MSFLAENERLLARYKHDHAQWTAGMEHLRAAVKTAERAIRSITGRSKARERAKAHLRLAQAKLEAHRACEPQPPELYTFNVAPESVGSW